MNYNLFQKLLPFCPYHFVLTILSSAILSEYHFVRIPFCPLPFCPVTSPSVYDRSRMEILLFLGELAWVHGALQSLAQHYGTRDFR